MFLIRRPSPAQIDRFLAESRGLPLSYVPVGLVRQPPEGFSVDEAAVVVGHGEAAFGRAKTALREWKQFDLGWVEVFPSGAPIDPGTTVAVLARHLGFWSMHGCRVVYRLGGDDGLESGFGYGTLTNHGEEGEETFSVAFDPASSAVSYRIRAVSRPRALLARLGYPLTRAFQARFRRDSAAAVSRAVGA
jgi:uncharacterized protein (UPF0548 family)